jgi:hypothetical protein
LVFELEEQTKADHARIEDAMLKARLEELDAEIRAAGVHLKSLEDDFQKVDPHP